MGWLEKDGDGDQRIICSVKLLVREKLKVNNKAIENLFYFSHILVKFFQTFKSALIRSEVTLLSEVSPEFWPALSRTVARKAIHARGAHWGLRCLGASPNSRTYFQSSFRFQLSLSGKPMGALYDFFRLFKELLLDCSHSNI